MITSYNNKISHKPSIIDAIIKQGVKNVPLLDALGSKDIASYHHSWLTDRYRDAKDNAQLEVSGFGDAITPTKQKTHNICQIVTNDLDVSWRQQDIAQYGEAELPYQRAKVGIEHAKDLEYQLLGLGNVDVFAEPKEMTSTQAGRMAGFFYFVPDEHRKKFGNGSGSVTPVEFTLNHLHQMLEPVWKRGGIDDGNFRVYMGNQLKNRVNGWIEKQPNLRQQFANGTISPLVTKIETDFGTIDIYLHRLFAGDALKDKVLIGNFDESKICYLRRTELSEISSEKTATFERYYTDFTLEVTNADYFACGTGLK